MPTCDRCGKEVLNVVSVFGPVTVDAIPRRGGGWSLTGNYRGTAPLADYHHPAQAQMFDAGPEPARHPEHHCP